MWLTLPGRFPSALVSTNYEFERLKRSPPHFLRWVGLNKFSDQPKWSCSNNRSTRGCAKVSCWRSTDADGKPSPFGPMSDFDGNCRRSDLSPRQVSQLLNRRSFSKARISNGGLQSHRGSCGPPGHKHPSLGFPLVSSPCCSPTSKGRPDCGRNIPPP